MSVALTVRFYTLSQFSLVLNEDTKWLISKAPLSPATPLPSYREKIKTSINSGIKRSGGREVASLSHEPPRGLSIAGKLS